MAEKLIIEGPCKLSGEIAVKGAKNNALKFMAASVLSEEEWRLENVPDILDIRAMAKLLADLGAKVEHPDKSTYIINGGSINKTDLNPEMVRKLRASVMLPAPLLARFGEVTMPHPGGCVIGQRPINIFLDGFRKFGADVDETKSGYRITMPKARTAEFVFPLISHTVTESMLMLASLLPGKSILHNTAQEPEVKALCETLNKCGAKINGGGTSHIEIEGVKKIGGGTFQVIPDRLETGAFVILGVASNSDMAITECNPQHLAVELAMIEKAGGKLDIGPDYVKVKPNGQLKAVNIRTHEYPGFATDLQSPFTVLMTQAEGASLIHETVFEGRLFYTDRLNQMGANVFMADPHRVLVTGPTKLRGSKVDSPDIRAGIALVIAALIAEGRSEIGNIGQIYRGYEDIETRLEKLGAKVKKETI